MRFPMINCLKYAEQCQNGILKKTCQATRVPYSVMWISPRYYASIGSMGNPLIPDAEKHALRPFYVIFRPWREYYLNELTGRWRPLEIGDALDLM